jgi:hypothetical protein
MNGGSIGRFTRAFALSAAALFPAACLYGFAGGGLPREVRTVAIIPFDNETASAELPRELAEALREGMERRLGLRSAPEARADAVLRGKIARYELDVPVAISANRQQATSARRRLAISLDIELVQQSTGKVLWEKKGLIAEGEYAENAEAAGRKQAIDKIVSDIVEGAQSQW